MVTNFVIPPTRTWPADATTSGSLAAALDGYCRLPLPARMQLALLPLRQVVPEPVCRPRREYPLVV